MKTYRIYPEVTDSPDTACLVLSSNGVDIEEYEFCTCLAPGVAVKYAFEQAMADLIDTVGGPASFEVALNPEGEKETIVEEFAYETLERLWRKKLDAE